jgi:hypothetical protein
LNCEYLALLAVPHATQVLPKSVIEIGISNVENDLYFARIVSMTLGAVGSVGAGVSVNFSVILGVRIP